MKKEELARLDGMQFALEIAEKRGVQGLREEVEYRHRYKVPLNVSKKEVDEFVKNAKCNMVDTVKIVAAIILHDNFGFRKQRVEKFMVQFENKCECIVKDYVTFTDMQQVLEDEIKIKLGIRSNDKSVRIQTRKAGRV